MSKRLISILLCAVLLLGSGAVSTDIVHAEPDYNRPIYYGKNLVGYYNTQGQIEYIPSSDGNLNYKALTSMLQNLKSPTIIIPSGSDFFINGSLRPRSNTTIIATGAKLTFKANANAIFTDPTLGINNLSIIGGTWRSAEKSGRSGSFFVFAHASNITMDGVNCNANYTGHSVEIIACKNITIKNCVINAIGSCPKTCQEEQIQIDLATPKTAPNIEKYGAKYVQGQTCQNIYILNNTVQGARAICVNRDPSQNGKWHKKFHKNIVVQGNNLTGKTSEALVYYNTIGGTIDGNTIVTKATRKTNKSAYTVGLRVQFFGKAPASMKKSKLYITNNIIKGKLNGIHIRALYKNNKCISKFGTIYVKKNKIYCKKGKKHAIYQAKKSSRKLVKSGNKCYKWK